MTIFNAKKSNKKHRFNKSNNHDAKNDELC